METVREKDRSDTDLPRQDIRLLGRVLGDIIRDRSDFRFGRAHPVNVNPLPSRRRQISPA